jgi:tellurite resistance protein TerC
MAWGGFLLFVLLMLAIDLGVVNRKAHVVSVREALIFTTVLVVLALGFTVFVYFAYENHWLDLGAHLDRIDNTVNDGRLASIKFLTGYLIELSLSADNVFVMAMIFSHLRIPPQFQHRVLFWGILGALIMRGLMIVLGTALIAKYHWILYVFGAFLLYTAVRMLLTKDEGTPRG